MAETTQLSIEISDERLSDLLCCAFEGGSNYWYYIRAHQIATGADVHSIRSADQYYPHLDLPFLAGCGLVIETLNKDEIDGKCEWVLDSAATRRGLQVMADKYPAHLADFLNENDDATTGDVYLQCCLFGEVVFG